MCVVENFVCIIKLQLRKFLGKKNRRKFHLVLQNFRIPLSTFKNEFNEFTVHRINEKKNRIYADDAILHILAFSYINEFYIH